MFQTINVTVNNPDSDIEVIDAPIYDGPVANAHTVLIAGEYAASATAADGEMYDATLTVTESGATLKPSTSWYAAMGNAFEEFDARPSDTRKPDYDAPDGFWETWYMPWINDEATHAKAVAAHIDGAVTLGGDGENEGVVNDEWEWSDAYTHIAFIGNHVTKSCMVADADAPSDGVFAGRWFIEWGSRFTGFTGGHTATSFYMHDDPEVIAKAIVDHYKAHPTPFNTCTECGAKTVTGNQLGTHVEYDRYGDVHTH